MTIVAGIVERGSVYMMADSIGIGGYDFTIRRDEKMFTVGPFLIGICGSFRMRDLLRYSLNAPEPPESMPDDEYIRTGFINAVRDCLKQGGYAHVENNVEEGGNFLVGYRGRLYEVEDDFQVGESLDGIAAIGCGWSYAKGALHATPKLPPRKRLTVALQASERFCAGVRGPYHYAKQRGDR